MGGFQKKRVCVNTNKHLFSKCFFFTESRGFERKNLVLNYGNILWNCAVFYDHIFLVRRLQLHNLSHILFSSTLLLVFCSFLFHRVISGVFFVPSNHFDFCCFFIDGKLVWNHSSRVHFFLVAKKSENIYLFKFFGGF